MVKHSPVAGASKITSEVWALVPARAGSKGVINKNMQTIQDVSLIGLSVLAATESGAVQRCFVSTDSPMYAEEGIRYGASVPFLRPREAATDSATDLDVFLHFIKWAAGHLRELPWAIVHMRPTTPCREPDVVGQAISFASRVYDSATALRSVNLAPESPFKWFLQDKHGYLTDFARNRDLDASNRSRSEFEAVYVPNGYVDVLFTRHVLRTGLLHGNAVRPFVTDPVIEIDSQFELDLARQSRCVPARLLKAARLVRRSQTSLPREGLAGDSD